MDLTIDLPPFKDFDEASHAVLHYLHQQLGFGLWMMTRTSNDDWVVLHAEDHHYQVEEGQVFRWADSFCSKMVKGEGPFVAPDAKKIEVYKNSEIAKQVDIGAYIGVPIYLSSGELFGTLCAIDPQPQEQKIEQTLPLVQMCARLLATVLDNEFQLIEYRNQLNVLQEESTTDVLTGLLNRRGWQQRIQQEASRIQRYASPSCIFVIDLDDLKQVNDAMGHSKGDEYISKTADILSRAMREEDIVARLGGDEFAVLAIECSQEGAEAIHQKLRDELARANIKASVGFANHHYGDALQKTFDLADKAMYQEKYAKRS